MKNISIVLSIMMSLLTYSAKSDVLIWQVDDTATIDGTPIQTWIMTSPYVEDDDHWVAARVKVTDGNGRILDIWYDNPDDPPARWDSGYWGSWIGDVGGGYWGTGMNQSPTGHKTWYASLDDPQTTILEDPALIEALFTIEIGYNSYNSDIDDYVWETLAESVPEETYEALRYKHMYEPGNLGPPNTDPWTPTEFFTASVVITPEPNAMILMLVGIAILALKRNYSIQKHGNLKT